MQFLYPAFLWALTALSIPVILHLFYFRRHKKVYFSNLRFLREVKEETSARNRLRNLLILLSRLLAMAFVIFAFAQPYIPVRDSVLAGIRNVSIFLDNSFSMQSFGQELSLFDRGRQKAKEIIMGYGQEDRFQLLGHELSPSQNLWVGRDEAITRLEEFDFTPEVKPLSVITGRQKQGFSKEDGSPVSWLISDFQESIVDLSMDSNLHLNLLPLRSVREKNVAIDSAWFDTPVQMLHQTSSLMFTIHNYANEDADNIRVTVNIDGQERPEGSADLGAGEMKTDTAQITVLKTGWHKVAIRISDFPVTFDDTYYISFYVDENLRILSIYEQNENPAIAAVFANPKDFVYDRSLANNLNYASFRDYDLIILQELKTLTSGLISVLDKYVKEGGKVLFIPSSSGDLAQYNEFLRRISASAWLPYSMQERQVGKINTDAFVYRDVFARTRPNMRLPKVISSFPQAGSGTRGQSLLAFRDGGDLLTFYEVEKGAVAVLSSPLDPAINDLSLQPEVFVPLLYKMAIYSSDIKPLSYIIGRDQLISVGDLNPASGMEFQVSGASEFIPGVSTLGSKLMLDMQGEVGEAGFYDVMQGGLTVASLAFNYDRTESDLTLYELDDLPGKEYLTIWDEDDNKDFTRLIEETQQGKQLWKWCIILALLFIGLEIALIRLWKNT